MVCVRHITVATILVRRAETIIALAVLYLCAVGLYEVVMYVARH